MHTLFTEILDRARKRRERAASLAAAVERLPHRSIRMSRPDGWTALIGPCMSSPGMFRVTRIDERGPVGHTEFPTLSKVIDGALQEGFEPVDK